MEIWDLPALLKSQTIPKIQTEQSLVLLLSLNFLK